MTGIVLAGRRNAGRLRSAAPEVAWEALVPLAGRPMASYVIAALQASAQIQRVVVAGPPELGGDGVLVVAPGDGVVDSLRNALQAVPLDPADAYLIATGDAPLLTGDAVDALIGCARFRGLGFAYPVVPRVACEARFPGVKRTYVRLRDGEFTGGNCFLLSAGALQVALGLLAEVYAARKRPWRLARLLGVGFSLRLVLGFAGVREAEAAASRLLGCAAGAVLAEDAGIGVDVDTMEHLVWCRRVLESGGSVAAPPRGAARDPQMAEGRGAPPRG